MNLNDVGNIVATTLFASFGNFLNFLPQLLAGIIVLIVGVLLAQLVFWLITTTLGAIQLEDYLKRNNLGQTSDRTLTVSSLISELVRWFIIIVFLVAALKAWGLDSAVSLVGQVVGFIDTLAAIVAVTVVGGVIAHLGRRIVTFVLAPAGSKIVNTTASLTRWVVFGFTGLVILQTLGVSGDLIRVVFIGIVASFTIALGLALGLGSQELGKDFSRSLKERFWSKKDN